MTSWRDFYAGVAFGTAVTTLVCVIMLQVAG